jgi:hypothetical protein
MAYRGLIAQMSYDPSDYILAKIDNRPVDGDNAREQPLVWRAAEGFDPELLRFWLLFWDEIGFPAWSDDVLVLGGDQQELLNNGFLLQINLSQPDIDGSPIWNEFADMDDRLFSEMQMCAFRKLNGKDSGSWSIALDAKKDHPQSSRDGRSILVRLYDALPIPSSKVSFEEVIDFRERRQPELLALRHHLEGLYQRILSAGDGELAIQTEREQLEMAIADYVRTINERRFEIKWANLEAQLKWEFNPSLAAVAVAAGFLLQGPALAAIAGAAAAMTPKIEVSTTTSFEGQKPSKTPFAYLGAISKKL